MMMGQAYQLLSSFYTPLCTEPGTKGYEVAFHPHAALLAPSPHEHVYLY